MSNSNLATPVWLTSAVGKATACLGLLTIGIGACAWVGILKTPASDSAGAACVLAGCVFAWLQLRKLCRRGGCPPEFFSFWRMQRTVVLLFALAAVSWAATAHLVGDTAFYARAGSVLLVLISLGALLRALVRIPSGDLSTRHKVISSLDLTTMGIAGMVSFWMLAIQHIVLAPNAEEALDTAVARSALVALFAFLALLLLSTLVLMPFRSHDRHVGLGLRSLVAAVIALIATDILPYCMELARTDFGSTHPTYIGWTLLMLGIGLHARLALEPGSAPDEETPAHVRVAMPYAALGLLVTLALTGLVLVVEGRSSQVRHLDEIGNVAVFLVALSAAFVLVVMRQTMIAGENYALALEMKRAKEVAESANNARLHFLANISHDLRTPLNGVLGCAQILLREKSMGSKQKELLKTIQGCGEHLRNLINDLLDLSKLEADKLELAPSPFDLKGLLGALIKTFVLEAETKRIGLELEQAPDLPDWIQCDRKRLQQILGNLVHNAIKFTDHGRVTVRARVSGPALIFEVVDTGCGIMHEKFSELFQPFHVVDARSIKLEGTGLGLSICKKLANKMGGDISIASKVGKGSVFTVVIPLVSAQPVVEVQRTVVDYQGRRRRILIVDDNPANRVVLRTMLEPLDFLVHEADGAAAAHEQLKLAHPDIVLMDLMMPGTDGFTLCGQILEMDILRMPVLIAVSAMAGEDVLERCRKVGFADLLNKPVHLDALVSALRVHAGIEWTYGIIQPAPTEVVAASIPEKLILPPAEEVSAFLDLARRGVVRNIETRAEQLAHKHPEYSPFARRVAHYARDFKLKELGEWLGTLKTPPIHGSA